MFEKELRFKMSRSGGSGGQHVNKVATRVELMFDVPGSKLLSEEQKKMILDRYATKISKEGIWRIVCDSTRSQQENKRIAILQFIRLIREGLKKKRKRIPTRSTRSSREKRLDRKKRHSQKKEFRKRPEW